MKRKDREKKKDRPLTEQEIRFEQARKESLKRYEKALKELRKH